MDQQLRLKEQLKSLVERYYEKKFLQDIKAFKRPKILSIIILSIRYFYQLQLLISTSLIDKLQSIDDKFNIIESLSIFTSYTYDYIVLIIICSLNIVIITLFILLFLQDIAGIQNSKLMQKVVLIFSFFVQIYNYIIFIPSVFFSLNCYYEFSLGYINLPLTLLIGIIVSVHDQDFSIIVSDFLAQDSHKLHQMMHLAIQVLQICFYVFSEDVKATCSMSIIIGLSNIYTFNQFRSELIVRLNIFLSLFITLTTIITSISVQADSPFPLALSLMLIVPISFSISQRLSKYYFDLERLQLTNNLINQPAKLNLFVRQSLASIYIEFENYRTHYYSLVLEQIVTDHVKYCNQYPSCFCLMRDENESLSEGKLNLMSGEKTKKYLLDYLFKTLQGCVNQMIKRKQDIDFDLIFCYLNYLIEVQQSKLLFYVELIRLKKSLNLTSYQKCFANRIFEKANIYFHNLLITSTRTYQNKEEKIMNNEYHQESQKIKQIELTNLHQAITFDEELNSVEKEYFQILEQKEEILVILSNDFINLQQFKNLSLFFLKQRNVILNQLQELNQINNKSFRLNNLLDGYCQIIGFGVERYKLFDQRSKLNNPYNDVTQTNQQSNTDQKISNALSLFSRSISIIFITLIERPGTIKRLQNSFSSIFGYSVIEALNKDISLVIPKLIGQFHSNLLIDYFTQPNINSNNGSGQMSSLLGRDSQGWAVPISIHFKSDCIGIDDYGFTGYIEKLKNDYNYVMVSESDFKVQIMCKHLYDKVFYQYCHNQSELNDVLLNQIIPVLKYFDSLKSSQRFLDNQNSFDSIAFLPKIKSQTNQKVKQWSFYQQISFEDQILRLQNMNISDFQVYQVRFRLVSIQNKYFGYHTIEFHSFRQVKHLGSIRDSLIFLSYQFQNLLNTQINFENQIQQLNKLQSVLSSQQNNLNENTVYLQNENIDDSHILKSKQRLQLSQVDSMVLDQAPFYNENSQNQEEFHVQTAKEANTTYQSQLESIKMSFSPNQVSDSEREISQKYYFQQSKDNKEKYLNLQKEQYAALSSHRLKQQQIDNDEQFDLKSHSEIHNQTQQLDFNSPNANSLKPINSNTHLYFSSKKGFDNQKQLNSFNRQYIGEVQGEEEEDDNNQDKDDKNIPPLTSQRIPLKDQMQNNQEKKRKTNWFSILKQKMINKKNKKHEDLFSSQLVDSQRIKNSQFKNNQFQQSNINQVRDNERKIFQNTMKNFELTLQIEEFMSENGNHFNDEDEEEEYEEDGISKIHKTEEDISENSHGRSCNKNPQQTNLKQQQSQMQTIKTKNLKNLKKKIKKEKNEMQITAEVSSSYNNSSVSSVRKSVKKRIIEKRNNTLLTILKIFGFISVLCIVIITFVVYYQMVLNFQIAQETFKFVTWPLIFRCNYSISSHYMAILQIIRRKVFTNVRFDAAYEADIKNRVDFAVSDLDSLLFQFVSGDQDKLSFFQNVTHTTLKMIINKDLATISGNELLYNAQDKIFVNMTLAYYLQTSVGYIYRYSTVKKNLQEQIVRLDNVPGLISNVTMIGVNIQQQCQNILDSIQNQALILMIVIIIIVFLFVISVFPLYAHIQNKCENVLKLFATLQQDHIDDMIKPINQALLLASRQQKIRLPQIIHKSLYVKKRKNTSQTDHLPKFRLSFVFISFFIFIALIIQPITIYIQVLDFASQALDSILLLGNIFTFLKYNQFFYQTFTILSPKIFLKIFIFILFPKGTLYDLRAQSISSTSQNYQYLLYRLDSTYLLYNPPYYIKRIPSLLTQNDQKIQNVINVISQSDSKSKYQQGMYDSFFKNIIYGNICQTMKDYPQYVQAQDYVDYDMCMQTRHGMLQKGFTLAFRDFLSEFQELSGLFNITNPTEFQTQIQAWQNRVDLRDFDDLFTILSRSLNSMKNFLLQMMSDQLVYNQYIQMVLLGYQYAMLAFVFYFGWVNFYRTVSKEMYEVRQLLSIVNIEVILENSYIQSFLNDQ